MSVSAPRGKFRDRCQFKEGPCSKLKVSRLRNEGTRPGPALSAHLRDSFLICFLV